MRACPALLLFALTVHAQDSLRYWAPGNRKAYAAREQALVDLVEADALRRYHEMLAAQPHRAGTEGDLRVASIIAGHFRKMGLEVEMQELWLYLAHPVVGEVEVVGGPKLSVKEEGVDGFSGKEGTAIGWNAFSGSGEVTAGVVYANFGRLEDYKQLAELGVEVEGKIVIARYGGNFRGYKVKFAEEMGAAGVIIYTDPADSGWGKGLSYPEGGYANGSSIQRGSILTLDYRGDPLTPGRPATKDAERLDPATVAFPKIPVQPIGWDAAKEILSRMRGPSVPKDWQGGLPFRYRLGGGAVRVRLKVAQERRLTKTYNVTATLRGAKFPEELVLIGSHHDAWEFGAGDPLAGTILILEAARCFSQAARDGKPPGRSILFCAWAAEEYGLMGSVEWVEANQRRLSNRAIAYLNLDSAALGTEIASSASPSLRPLIRDLVRDETGADLKQFGDLGGGSDHVGFLCRFGIPCASLSGRGAKGVSYHSLYDNLDWYRMVVGESYKPAATLARASIRLVARLANADLLPLEPGEYFERALGELKAEDWRARFESSRDFARSQQGRTRAALGKLPPEALAQINRNRVAMERAWLGRGLPGRPWYRNVFSGPDENSGYAAWVLPAMRSLRVKESPGALMRARQDIQRAAKRINDLLRKNQDLADAPGR